MAAHNKEILTKTQSICPICHKPIDAFYIENEGKVYIEKTCIEHGTCSTLVAENSSDYIEWVKNPVVNIPPKNPMTEGDIRDNSCPLNCGTCTNHLQTACCVLIDITNRCNQHCPYCFAGAAEAKVEEGEAKAGEEATEAEAQAGEPTLEELEKKFDLLIELGEERTFNIQISGGEPTVRDDLPEIIKMARAKGFTYIQINSNGRRFAEEEGYAAKIKEAGASVIFMQFDGTNDEIYMKLRNEPLFEKKKKAIRNCEKAGLPVTLVPTIVRGVNSDNIGEMMDFLLANVNVVKGIHFQPVSFFGRHPEKPQKRNDEASGEKSGGFPREMSGNFPGRITMFELLHELEGQSPQFKYNDFCPIATGHTLCCFYSTYIREPDGSARCTLTKERREAGIACCDTATMDRSEVIRKDRDFVVNKWEIAPPPEKDEEAEIQEYKSSAEITSLDEFLRYFNRNMFTVSGMAFQDITNLDAERLKRCRVQVLSEDNRLIPFCAYNSIYRQE